MVLLLLSSISPHTGCEEKEREQGEKYTRPLLTGLYFSEKAFTSPCLFCFVRLNRLALFRYIICYSKYLYDKDFLEGMVKDATG